MTRVIKNLNKNSRAGKYGTILKCPICSTRTTVYHMAWSAIACSNCRSMVEKYDWLKHKNKTRSESQN